MTADCQVHLQIEKKHSLKTKKIFPYTQLDIRISGEPKKTWHAVKLEDLDIQTNILYFDAMTIHLDSISEIRLGKRKGLATIGNILLKFSSQLCFWGAIDQLHVKTISLANYLILCPATALSGYILTKIVRDRSYQLKKKHRARIIDLTITAPPIRA